jgi:hypothetical protein
LCCKDCIAFRDQTFDKVFDFGFSFHNFLILFPNLRTFPLRAEAFEFRELFHRLQRLLERGAIVFHHARAALELIYRQVATGVAVAI